MAEDQGRASARRPTRLIVDRAAIATNAAIVRARLSPGTRLMAVVKANGYGHGSIESARAAIEGGANQLGVATVAEARELREAGFDVPILVLGSSAPQEAYTAAAFAISIGVGDLDQFGMLQQLFRARPPVRPIDVHLKIDTGMRRFGVSPAQSPLLAQQISLDPNLRLEGVYSHFAESDGPASDRMDQQLSLFLRTLDAIDRLGIDHGLAHISNSGAVLRNRSADLDMVRAGICLYGISPSEHVALWEGMRPALEWRATVQHVAELGPGDRVGYGGTYVATEHERIALLPVGYADGYPRPLSSLGWAGYRSHRLPIRGRISMDQTTVGIPEGLSLAVGNEVTLLGGPESGAPDADELGTLIGTIGYEIVSRIARRVPVDYR